MLKTLHMHTSFIFSICPYEIEIGQEKRIMVASGGGDSFIYVWDIKQLQYNEEYVVKACYKPIKLSLQQPQEKDEGEEPNQYTSQQLEFNHYVPVYRQNIEMLVLCMAQCGKYLIAGYNSNEIVRWTLKLKINKQEIIKEAEKNEFFLLKPHNDSVNALDSINKLIASGSDDLCLMIQDVDGNLMIQYYCDEPVDAVKFQSSDKVVFATNQHIFILELAQKQIQSIQKLKLENPHQNIIQLCIYKNQFYFSTKKGVYQLTLEQILQQNTNSKDTYYLFQANQQNQNNQYSECDLYQITEFSIQTIQQISDNDQNEIKGLYSSQESLYILTNRFYYALKEQYCMPLKQSLKKQMSLEQGRLSLQEYQEQLKQQKNSQIRYSENYEQILQQILVIDKFRFIGGDLFRFIEIQQQKN